MTPSTNLTYFKPDNSPFGEHSQSCFTSLNKRACRMSSCISSFCIVCKNSRKVAILHSKAFIPYRRTKRVIGSIERSIYSSFFSALDFDTKLSFCIFVRITALTVPSTLTHTDPCRLRIQNLQKSNRSQLQFSVNCAIMGTRRSVLISCG